MKKFINKLNKSKTLRIVLITLLILILIFVYFFIKNDYSLDFLNFSKKASLSTTEVNTKIKEGVYITDVSEVVENTMPAIVAITSKTLIQSGGYGPFSFGNNSQQYTTGAGSGIIISNTDNEILIVTNNHVVDDSTELTVQFIDEKTADATIKGKSENKDIAVISVKKSDLSEETLNTIKIATLGDSNSLKVGNGIIAIGNALGYGQSVTTGVVSALNRKIEDESSYSNMIQIDAAINGGNSGGALLNSKGEVVGINSAKYSSSGTSTTASIEGMGFAIPISDVKDLIESLANGEEESEGIKLGIEGYMTNSSNLSGYNFPTGFYISDIESGSYAANSDLEIGNIITEIDGNAVESVNDITNVLDTKKEGDAVKIKVKYINNRNYKEKELTIKLDK